MISLAFSTGLFTPLCPVADARLACLLALMHHKYRWSGVIVPRVGLATPSSVAPIHPFWAASPFVSSPPPLCVIL